MALANTRIGVRLAIGFTLILLLVVVITGVGIWRLQQTGAAVNAMVSQFLVRERLAAEWQDAVTINAVRTMAVVRSNDSKTQQAFQSEMSATSERASELQTKLHGLSSEEGRQALGEIAAARAAYTELRESVLTTRQHGSAETVNAMIEKELDPARKEYMAKLQKFVDVQRKAIDDEALKIDANYRSGRILLIAFGSLAIILGALLSWRLTAGIVNPLQAAVAVARRVAAGDLTSTIEVKSRDETGQLLQGIKEMNRALQDTVSRVRNGTDNIVTASRQIAAGNLELSSRTEQQAASLEQTAASMEQLTSTVKQNADNARQANQLAENASSVALGGGRMVSEVVATMSQIKESSHKINDIIGVIDGIAFQTNILALNAAVEAARAGEQGRGFAVVAAEVRNLAQRSAVAAKDIKLLIGDSVDKVDAGNRQVDAAGKTMSEIVDSIRRVVDIMAEIAAASTEQSSGIEQVNQAVVQMDQATQQNAALVEEAAAAAHSLQEQADELLQAVHIFNLADEEEMHPPGGSGKETVVSLPTRQESSEVQFNDVNKVPFLAAAN
ncbi:methyl-accepting chemotaxis (MCP) signaling domain protein [Collimonas arenae]|uniref:Methyl-accepting chemotaxis (MCP) signaling domain protein n=1 Tax=Collimonas arenae TaxID=279058 RepID=A0A127QFI3_9BURK|nr:methyl-accepting chemotaxis protein [Collimonas arenae]AMO98869.1 methyl-accepting chemotaxis (MCP) signaling domain protein [Collimonas arenae]AMP08764.1 methyl-accepting chemotaxis (MCP) signaling domain protein [Collimonas arenae]